MNIIDLYVRNLTKDDIINFSKKNNISLSNDELDFTYTFIKNNYKEVIKEKDRFDLSMYRSKFSPDNYNKIYNLIKKYISYL